MNLVLQWDKGENTDYFVVFYGTVSNAYTKKTEKIMSPKTEYIFNGLPEKPHYFVVKAYNKSGHSSQFSDEVASSDFPGKVKGVYVEREVG